MLPSNPRTGQSRSVSRQPTMTQQRSVSRPRERYSVEDDRGGRGRNQDRSTSYQRQVRPQRSVGIMQYPRNKEPALPPPPSPRERYSAQDDRGGRGRQVRPQRPMGVMQYPRNKEPALPPPPSPTQRSRVRSPATRPAPSAYPRPPPSRESDSSSSSLSSSGSSTFLDRMRHRGGAGSSSQSSFELDPEGAKETRGSDDYRKPGLFWEGTATSSRAEEESSANDLVSYGYSIWNRVATAASAWAWNGSSNDAVKGVAPSSGDSEITRALKNYYISKARDRSDLPDWLFDERERGVGMEEVAPRSMCYDEQHATGAAEPIARARGRGFRDIYDSVASDTPEPRVHERNDNYRAPVPGSGNTTPSRANDRLKALRDAKRQAATASRVAESVGGRGAIERRSVDVYDTRYEDSWSSGRGARDVMGADPGKRMPVRVGLPTNPRRR
ncbi:uncharacterized protein FOMMEDRAFT_166309 [Fomitiporia mediterranea MF3/22]|uniref:uncharacterized protein n=1 Tax=Fomitiporia mediterranea (strain MF3/22) TaxID=694068 RepID=UPI00044081FE|nr:uncharacterized protein FOMMEDRAFT_166309 [Fomitiporia mediterranea MF3/22]EJD06012.1 hypothetical protein FOMMEDRAFT_166309 [Fomitiporia mediterranea MF3/22]